MAQRMGFHEIAFYGDHFDLAPFGLIVHEANLESRRAYMKRALRAFLKSHVYALQNREESVRWVLKNLKVEKQDTGKTVDLLVKIATRDGIATDTAIQMLWIRP